MINLEINSLYILSTFIKIRYKMEEEEIPHKKKVGPKIKYHDNLHEYFRKKAREYYWRKKMAEESGVQEE